jgi:hypothetical protein
VVRVLLPRRVVVALDARTIAVFLSVVLTLSLATAVLGRFLELLTDGRTELGFDRVRVSAMTRALSSS